MSTKQAFHAIVTDNGIRSGFRLTFENGWGISVQFGECAYAEGQCKDGPEIGMADKAEVAIFQPDGEFYAITEHDQVLGWQTSDDVAQWVAFTASQEG